MEQAQKDLIKIQEAKDKEDTVTHNKLLLKMIETAIPVKKAVFHQAIANGYKDPETNFASDDVKVGRRVDMYLTPNLLICFQNGRFFATPHANLVYVSF